MTDGRPEVDLSKIRYTLRSLPGVAAVEALCLKAASHPNPLWAPEIEEVEAAVPAISRTLFGITEEDTHYSSSGSDLSFDERMTEMDTWEANFDMPEFDDPELQEDADRLLWAVRGWDVTDGTGETLLCLPYFERQMICANTGLKGRLPDAEMSDQEAADAAERWAENLKR